MKQFDKIRKLTANQFLSDLQDRHLKKTSVAITPGSLNYHLKYQSKEIQTTLLECQVDRMVNKLESYETEWEVMTEQNIALTKQN